MNIKKRILLSIFLIGGCLLLASWAATQSVAKDCSYSPTLGFLIYQTKAGHPVYFPLAYWIWKVQFGAIIPKILSSVTRYFYYALYGGVFLSIIVNSKMNNHSTSHGSAEWANEKDVKKAGFETPEGVILGFNPYKKMFMRHDGPEHIMVMAPTRSGKGVGVIIPTCITWKHSLFVLDVKKENWNYTAYYRHYVLKQKVIKFEPFCQDGTSACWNPIAEIRMMTPRESGDILNMANLLADPDGKGAEGSNKHWIVTAVSMIVTVITHLLYVHYRLKKLPPTMNDIALFLSSPDKTHDEQLDDMMVYPHITPDDFFNNNIFEKIYGGGDSRQPYINLNNFCENLPDDEQLDTSLIKDIRLKYLNRKKQFIEEQLPKNFFSKMRKKQSSLTLKLKKELYEIEYDINHIEETNLSVFRTLNELKDYYRKMYNEGNMDFESEPFNSLLVHPTVASGAAEMKNRESKEEGSVLSTAMEAFVIYRDPLISKHTSKSDFMAKDLMNPKQAVSLYLATSPDDLQTLAPLIRLLITFILNKNMEEIKFKKSTKVGKVKQLIKKIIKTDRPKKTKKQRCLLLMDEFPQLGKMEKMELALAVMAGYGLKALIICQDINQLNKAYSKDNSILSNCHIRVFFTPNDSDTPQIISKMLGKYTISVTSKSNNGKELLTSSQSISQTARDLMAPDEVNKLPSDRSIIFIAGQKPIYGKKLFYFNEEFFNKRIDAFPYAESEENPLKSDIATAVTSYNEILPTECCNIIDVPFKATESAKEEKTEEKQQIMKRSEDKPVEQTEPTAAINNITNNDITSTQMGLLAMLSDMDISNAEDLKDALNNNKSISDEVVQKDEELQSEYLANINSNSDDDTSSIMVNKNEVFDDETDDSIENIDPIIEAAMAATINPVKDEDSEAEVFGGSDFY